MTDSRKSSSMQIQVELDVQVADEFFSVILLRKKKKKENWHKTDRYA